MVRPVTTALIALVVFDVYVLDGRYTSGVLDIGRSLLHYIARWG
jgi:hypothetical protein